MEDKKVFDLCGRSMMFWTSGATVFCEPEYTETEVSRLIYCCGKRSLPETEEEAQKLLEKAWIW